MVAPETPGWHRVVKTFGRNILYKDNQLNREKLRGIVFADTEAKKTLEDILHPLIREYMNQQLAHLPETTPYCIKSIPLLVETRQHDTVDRVLVIDCDEQQQLQRLMQRDNLSSEEALRIIQTQVSRAERLQYADDIIDNTDQQENLEQQITDLHHRYQQLSS